jgi:hypothetical protein
MPLRTTFILLGTIPIIYCLYLGIHMGGMFQFYAIAIAAGCTVGTARAVKRYRQGNEALTRNIVWINAATGSWMATGLLGLLVGGPFMAAKAFGHALVAGSLSAWGFAVIGVEVFRGSAENVNKSSDTATPSA